MATFKGYSFYKNQSGNSGLVAKGKILQLNGQPLRIISGTIHYFRVVPEYWRDRLLKLKACGCNCLETYVAWNFHENLPGEFDFEGIRNVRKFIEIAAELDLLVIFRPGPFICAEWEFGGLPSWLLRDENMAVRTNYPPFIAATDRFFGKLLPLVDDLQFTKNGPIIMVQVENEYGSYGSDTSYMDGIGGLLKKHGIQEMLCTSDGPQDLEPGRASDVWLTVNGQENLGEKLDVLAALQPDRPLMVMEYWTGWFDHWNEPRHKTRTEKYVTELSTILSRGASVNFYVFHGGSNFGFMNGANTCLNSALPYEPTITSYDYDCLVSEAGDLTEKWHTTRQVLDGFGLLPKDLPNPPEKIPSKGYGRLTAIFLMNLREKLEMSPRLESKTLLPMELLKYKKGYGQAFGFIAYEKDIPNLAGQLVIEEVHDRAIVFVNYEEQALIEYTKSTEKNHEIQIKPIQDGSETLRLIIFVENMGRVNFNRTEPRAFDVQRKGIIGGATLNGQALTDWVIRPVEFLDAEMEKICDPDAKDWKNSENFSSGNFSTPAVFKFDLEIDETPHDTFLDMSGWGRGVAFVNGFNLGRYWPSAGPQRTLYVPAPVLKKGKNTFVVFELHTAQPEINLVAEHVLDENGSFAYL